MKVFSHKPCEDTRNHGLALEALEKLERENAVMRKYFKSKKNIKGIVERMSGLVLNKENI